MGSIELTGNKHEFMIHLLPLFRENRFVISQIFRIYTTMLNAVVMIPGLITKKKNNKIISWFFNRINHIDTLTTQFVSIRSNSSEHYKDHSIEISISVLSWSNSKIK